MKVLKAGLLAAVLAGSTAPPAPAQDPAPPALTLSLSNAQATLQWVPFPAAAEYRIFSTDDLGVPFVENKNGLLGGSVWAAPSAGGQRFYQLRVTPLDSKALLTATVLSRLTYGPTPDELERVRAAGPEAFIDEQLAPESIGENLAIDTDALSGITDWQWVTLTGTPNTGSPYIYIYLNVPGEGYVDDIRLVRGTNPGVGANLIRNGDFEAALATNDWTISANHAVSSITTAVKRSGNSSLHLVASRAGTTRASSVWQRINGLSSSTHTLSYWFLPSTTSRAPVTVRLSSAAALAPQYPPITKLTHRFAAIDDLRAWHILHAVQSKRQLLEVLLQFLENHFVTEYTKSRDYLDRYYDNPERNWHAVRLELKELERWRAALLKPECTFYDLLRISAESPAMIIYLDTVNSRGDGGRVANENYARELLELFTFGVDNGYDQNDIVQTSRAWTGWTIRLVNATNEFNPFAPQTTVRVPNAPNGSISNLVGVWSYGYRTDRHNNAAKRIFPGKRVPDRFGAPYAGRSYELVLPARAGNSGIQDGYQILAHLANQPFTQEFMSVKLCRLFVHDDFETGYDFTHPNLSAEGRLVRQCMDAWEGSRGQIRPVLRTIFDSDLFRSHVGSLQKVKTPLEFTVSAVRAFRSANGAAFTSETDGFLSAALNRMGAMRLFDRTDPDGYPESSPPWISAGTLAERLRFVQALMLPRNQRSGVTDLNNNTYNDPVALLKMKLPSATWNNAGAVADYFLDLLYPGEGAANLDLYRAAAVGFLNTADNGTTPSPLATLSSISSAYDLRVRGMVSMLLTFQRFQEQ